MSNLGAAVEEIDGAVFADCARVLSGEMRVDDAAAMSARGYTIQPPDSEGLWAAKSFGDYEILIGVGPGKPGCRLRFRGSEATPIYEGVLRRLHVRGFSFVNGERNAPEPQFVMDTLAQEDGPIGIVSMFRMNMPDAMSFAMTLYPSIGN